MNIIKFSFKKFTILIFIGLSIFPTNKVKSAEEIKIVYSIFSRTINVEELKEFALYGNADKNFRRLLKLTNTENDETKEILRNGKHSHKS